MIFLGAVLVALSLLACDTGTFTALLNFGTATPTRTARPTFTPRPAATPTLEDTPTPEATATIAASPTASPRATAVPRPAATKPPVATAPPPAPKFEWRQDPDTGHQGICDAGPGTFEVKGKIHDGHEYVGGVHIVALDAKGKMIAQMDSIYAEYQNIEWGVSCFEEKNRVSYQLDVAAGRMEQPFILRLVRSANDLTPISTDVKLIYPATGGRFYINWTK
jgi:hypothetical protein